MAFSDQLTQLIKEAMKAKDQVRLRTLRAIKAEILLVQTDGKGTVIDEAKELKIIQKMVKQRKDSLEIFEKQGREDLAQKEREEVAIMEEFLPKQMAETELEVAIKTIIEKTGATGPKDIGKIMGVAMKELAGKTDGKAISTMAKKLLV